MFYIPWIGTLILSIIWIACWWLLSKLLKLEGPWKALLMLPLSAMIVSEVDLGYILYNFKPYGYWFTQPLGFAIACAIALLLVNVRYKIIYLVAFGIVLYPVLGWWVTAAMILFALADRIKQQSMFLTREGCIALAVAFISPIAWQKLKDFPMHIYDTWSIGAYFSASWCIVYFLVLLLFIFAPLLQNKVKLNNKGQILLLGMLTLCCIIYAWSFSYHDKNYNSEIRMYRYAENGNWQAVMHEAKSMKGHPTEQIMMLREMALLHMGHLDQSFNYDCTTVPQNLNDGVESSLIQSAAPLVYLLHGRPNFSTQWCIESVTQTGMNITFLQILARCARLKGEEELAQKYLNMIHKSTFYSDWEIPAIDNITRDLYENTPEILDGDNGQCMQYLMFACANNPNYQQNQTSIELGLVYSIMIRDKKAFAHRYPQYRKEHPTDVPEAYKQAAQILMQ